MIAESSRPIEILLVDDNAGDVRLTCEAIKDAKVRNNMRVANNGIDAMTMLRNSGGLNEPPLPDLILLDLNMPRKDGRQVLAEIKADERLKVIPVVILTTSDDEHDILKSYQLHANCYITKPVDMGQFMKIVKSIENFWFTIVKLPQV